MKTPKNLKKFRYEVLLFHGQYLWRIVILNVILVWKYINTSLHSNCNDLEHKQQIVEDVKNQVQKLAGHCSVKLKALIE